MTVLAFDPAFKSTNISLVSPVWDGGSNGLATIGASANGWDIAAANISQTTGKFYVEFLCVQSLGSSMIGLCNSSVALNSWPGNTPSTAFGLQVGGSTFGTGGTPGWAAGFVPGAVAGIAYDVAAQKFWVRLNSASWLNGDPVAGTGGGTWSFAGAAFPCVGLSGGTPPSGMSTTDAIYINGGAYPFMAAAPSGFSALGSGSSLTTTPKTLDPNWHDSTTTLSGGNLIATFNNSAGVNFGFRSVGSTIAFANGQHYWEATVTIASGTMVSVGPPMSTIQNWVASNNTSILSGFSYEYDGSTFFNASASTAFSAFTIGDVICVALDCALEKIWMRKNGGAWQGGASPNPTTGSGGIDMTRTFARGLGAAMGYICGSGTPVAAMNYDGPFAFTSPFSSPVTASPSFFFGL